MEIRNFPFLIFKMDLPFNGNTHMDNCGYKL